MQLPAAVAVMILPNAILFPGVMLPLFIFEKRYQAMLQDVLAGDRVFAVAMQKPDAPRGTPAGVAGLGLVRAAVTHKDGTSHLVLQGLGRIELTGAVKKRPYRLETFQPLATKKKTSRAIRAYVPRVLALVEERFKQGLPLPLMNQFVEGMMKKSKKAPPSANSAAIHGIVKYLAELEDPDQLADLVSCTLLPAPAQRQAILECVDLERRLETLIVFLASEIATHQK